MNVKSDFKPEGRRLKKNEKEFLLSIDSRWCRDCLSVKRTKFFRKYKRGYVSYCIPCSDKRCSKYRARKSLLINAENVSTFKPKLSRLTTPESKALKNLGYIWCPSCEMTKELKFNTKNRSYCDECSPIKKKQYRELHKESERESKRRAH